MDNEKQGNGLAVVVAFFLGGLVGAILSLLFAPMRGRETREKIRGASADAKERTSEAAYKAKEATHKAREATREKVTVFVDQGKTRLDEAKGSMKAAVEAGKTAFLEKKAELADAISRESEEQEVDVAEVNQEESAS